MATILGSIIVFLLVVLLHEGGHFMAAKASDIKVNEFAVGMGPKIFQKKKFTQYCKRIQLCILQDSKLCMLTDLKHNKNF